MFCPACGAKNVDTAQFCAKCGKDLRGFKQTTGHQGVGRSYGEFSGAISNTTGVAGAARMSGAKLSPRLLIVVAVVVVAFAIFGITRCVNNPHASIEALAGSLTGSLQHVFDDDMSESSLESFGRAAVDLMPQQAVEALIERGGYDDREDVIDEIRDAASVESASSMLGSVDMDIELKEGYGLDDDYLDNVNRKLKDDLDLSLEVTDAKTLGMDVTITAREDIGTLSAGETVSQDTDSIGLVGIEIDGQWYLWVSGFNW